MMPELTPRQMEVLRLLAEGMNNAQIAFVIGISPRVVSGLVTTVLDKCGLTSRQQLPAYLARKAAP
jgi:DNA-binding NarL/FixJ family response regulator